MPRAYRPRIALVGRRNLGGASRCLQAGRFRCSRHRQSNTLKAEGRRDEYFPQAEATDDLARTLRRDDIDVVDITPHPAERRAMIETALKARKHVLSQKPSVLDLDAGRALCDLADASTNVYVESGWCYQARIVEFASSCRATRLFSVRTRRRMNRVCGCANWKCCVRSRRMGWALTRIILKTTSATTSPARLVGIEPTKPPKDLAEAEAASESYLRLTE